MPKPTSSPKKNFTSTFYTKHHDRWQTPSEILLALCIVLVPLSVQAGVLSLFVPTDTEGVVSTTTAPESDWLSDSLLSAAINPDPLEARGGAEIVVVDGALVAAGPVSEDDRTTSGGEISVYIVREGDTLSMIAEMFGVTANTILWANDIDSPRAIKPGQTLIILPIAGVRHVVKAGDTISSIAKKYDGDLAEIVAYNQVAEDADLTVGETIIVPGGALHQTPAVAKAPTRASGNTTATPTRGAGFSHPIPGAIKTQGIHGFNAVDFAAAVGTPIRAAAAGEVIVSKSSGWNGGYGQYIVVKHSNGSQTLYAHLSANYVSVGETVAAGATIGALGNTGRSTGPHLHFEVRGARNPF